jgi:hypothetical protein
MSFIGDIQNENSLYFLRSQAQFFDLNFVGPERMPDIQISGSPVEKKKANDPQKLIGISTLSTGFFCAVKFS